ncbi:heparinase II/III-family protein [Vibrio clamense]|uniref:heparinase II/III domain-containing protein n=1 Tax=Vibrio clamense TaxID=2910254 RepID=UPI003D1CA5DE
MQHKIVKLFYENGPKIFIFKVLRRVFRPIKSRLLSSLVFFRVYKLIPLKLDTSINYWVDTNVSDELLVNCLYHSSGKGYLLGKWIDLNPGKKIVYKDLTSHFDSGFDVKDIMESSRMNFLPTMALSIDNPKLSKDASLLIEKYLFKRLEEFQLDTQFQNINMWLCTMDSSIRICNFILTIQILSYKGYDVSLFNVDTSIKLHFCKLIFDDEFNFQESNNHYLLNLIAGGFVLFSSKPTTLIRLLRKLYLKRIVNECARQFNSDGSNFEDSTGYHRFVSESVLYFYHLLTCSVDMEKSNFAFIDKLENIIKKAHKFSVDISTTDFTQPIIGDNDSGYFFDFYCTLKFKDNSLSFQDRVRNVLKVLYKPEVDIFNSYMNTFDQRFDSHKGFIENVDKLILDCGKSVGPCNREILSESEFICDFFSNKRAVYTLSFSGEISRIVYSDFGLCILESDTFKLYFKFKGLSTGHSHSDLLSISLYMHGKGWVISDPGTSTYTSSKIERNRMRGIQAHFTPLVDTLKGTIEPVNFIDWFNVISSSTQFVISDEYILASYSYQGIEVSRRISVNESQLVVEDYLMSESQCKLIHNKSTKIYHRYGEASEEDTFDMSKIYAKQHCISSSQ